MKRTRLFTLPKLGTFLIAVLCPASCDTLATIGRPQVPKVSGFASTALERKSSWTLKRYTLAGASVDFLIRYPEKLRDAMGGGPVVVKNSVYRQLAALANRFSVRFSQDRGERGSLSLLGASDSERSYFEDETFLGKPFFVGAASGIAGILPDRAAIDVHLKEILRAGGGWRLAPGFSQVDMEPKTSKTELRSLLFWRSADVGTLRPELYKDEEAGKIVRLMRHVGGRSLPFGFYLQNHMVTLGGCGDEAMLANEEFPRYVNVDVVVVENNSTETLKVSGFAGGSNPSVPLRVRPADDRRLSGSPQGIPWPAFSIAKGERLVVPIRLVFTYGDYSFASASMPVLDDLNRKPAAADLRRVQSLYRNKPRGLEFMFTDYNADNEKETLRKFTMTYSVLQRIASRPWRSPIVDQDFIYGPSFRVTGLKVNTVGSAARGKEQSLIYASAGGFGSCPFLEVWDDELALWLKKGRVLVGAIGLGAKREEIYDLRKTPRRVKLREREPEESQISEVFLEIIADDGALRKIVPREGGAAVIGEGEERVFNFDISDELRSRPAKLHIVGCYLPRPRITWINR